MKWKTHAIKSICKPYSPLNTGGRPIEKNGSLSYLFGVIGNLINEANCKTIIVNGVEDHVHCFIGLKPVVSVSELMKTVKAKSSKYINDHQFTKTHFEWQVGYGFFSYGQSGVYNVYKYIQNQEAQHQNKLF
ncbi:hypothetical protein BH20BAC1_BH20BAC1_08530 [soil metagenome]